MHSLPAPIAPSALLAPSLLQVALFVRHVQLAHPPLLGPRHARHALPVRIPTVEMAPALSVRLAHFLAKVALNVRRVKLVTIPGSQL
jgi:hypothetical protein